MRRAKLFSHESRNFYRRIVKSVVGGIEVYGLVCLVNFCFILIWSKRVELRKRLVMVTRDHILFENEEVRILNVYFTL